MLFAGKTHSLRLCRFAHVCRMPIVLSVDDDPVNQTVIELLLEGRGYTVVQAMDGLEALEYLKSGSLPDLILLDVMMPEISGYEVCTKIRELYSWSIPVIMLSAKVSSEDVIRGLRCLCNDYVTKPFDKEGLISRINALVKLKQLQSAPKNNTPVLAVSVFGQISQIPTIFESIPTSIPNMHYLLNSKFVSNQMLLPEIRSFFEATAKTCRVKAAIGICNDEGRFISGEVIKKLNSIPWGSMCPEVAKISPEIANIVRTTAFLHEHAHMEEPALVPYTHSSTLDTHTSEQEYVEAYQGVSKLYKQVLATENENELLYLEIRRQRLENKIAAVTR